MLNKSVFIHFMFIILLSSTSTHAHPADPSPLLSNYALFGEEYLNFTEEAETQGTGWTGTNGYLEQSSSWVVFNNTLKIKGNFDAGTHEMTVYKESVYVKSSTSGSLSLVSDLLVTNASFPDPKLPDFPASEISVTDDNLIVKGSQNLSPGSYGRILLNDDNAEIILESGTYEIDSLIIRGTVRIPGNQKGATRILVKSFLHFDNAGPNGHRVVSQGDALGKVLLYCAGNSVVIDQSSRIDAALVTPVADISLATEIVVNGQIHAKSITFKNGFDGQDGTFIPFNPGNLLFPEEILAGIPEDKSEEPKVENSYLLSFPLLLTSNSEYYGRVEYQVLAEASKKPATIDNDFKTDAHGAQSSGTIHFSPGDSVSRDSIHIWIIDDLAHEDVEHIEVKLSSPDSITFENSDTTISYFIPIISEDPEYNELKGSGAAYDTLGDGVAHSVLLTLSEDLQESAVTELSYHWPSSENNKTVQLSDLQFHTNKQLSFPLETISGEGSGTGQITLDDETVLDFTILDSVGPVLKKGSAELLNEYSADTLTLEVSEPLQQFDTATKPELIFFNDSADITGDTVKAIEISKINATNYTVVLPKGSLSLGVWAQFNHKAETRDLRGNSPAPYNQKIDLHITVNKIPTFEVGALFDTKGTAGRLDGKADSGYIAVRLAADTAKITMHDLTAVNLDPDNKNIPLTWQVINDSLITFTSSDLEDIHSSQKVQLSFDNITIEGMLKDSVAPVIVAAQYEAWSSGDSLKVTFSEPIAEWGNLSPFHFHSGTDLKVQKKRTEGREAIYLVVGGEITESDSIWIRREGEIADTGSVYQQNDNNQHVPLTILTILSPIKASFRDTLGKPDGYIDGLTLKFNGTLTEAMIPALRKTIVLPKHRGLSFRNSVYTLEDSSVSFVLLQDTAAYRSTAVDSRDNLTFSHTVYAGDTALFLDSSLPITDSMGPVVISGHYLYGVYDESDISISSVSDTLKVTYSEPVLVPDSDTPFGFVGKDGEYQFSIVPGQEKGKTVAYERIYKKGGRLPEVNDSIYLIGEEALSDTSFISQNRDTKPALLVSNTYQQPFKFLVYPNPITLSQDGTFTNEYLHYSGEGDSFNKLSVIVIPQGIRPVADTVAVKMVLIDPVGNEIFQEDLTVSYRNVQGDWVCSVPAKNRNGRVLGRGSYSLQLKLTGAGEAVHQQLLGVQQALYPKK